MKKMMILLALVIIGLSSCGSNSENQNDSQTNCTQQTSINFNIDVLDSDGSDFSVVKAWRGGWVYGMEDMKLNVYVTFTTEDYVVSKTSGPEHYKLPQVIQLNVNAPMFKDGDEPIEVEAGSFNYGLSNSQEASANIVVLQNGTGNDQFPDPEGTAEISYLGEDKICGIAKFKSSNGNTIDLSFSVPFEDYDAFSNVRKK